ncbi:MAG TPA: DMT family transporter [Patescibacteria group bacterium]|nr:DMT family transporter [Patescibacteria group bacterium]
MRLSKYQLAILALITTNIIWGASIPIFKWSLESMPPFTFAFLRFFFASLFLLPFTVHKLKISRRDLVSLFVLAIVGFVFQIGFLLLGLSISSSINSAIILTSAPVFLIIGSTFFLKERLSQRIIVGTLISLAGVVVIILRPVFDKGLDGTIIGNVLFVFSTLSLVGYSILLKNFVTHLKTITITWYLFAFAALIFFPFFLMESTQHQLKQILTPEATFGVLFGAIFTSIIGYLGYNYGIKTIKASEVGLFLYVDPIVTGLVAVPLLHEKITQIFLLGAMLVFVGIFIAERRIHYHPINKIFKP